MCKPTDQNNQTAQNAHQRSTESPQSLALFIAESERQRQALLAVLLRSHRQLAELSDQLASLIEIMGYGLPKQDDFLRAPSRIERETDSGYKTSFDESHEPGVR